jgi:hypothetical protein
MKGISKDRRLINQAIAFRKKHGTYPFHHGYIPVDGEWKHHVTGAGLFDSIGNAFRSVGNSIAGVANQAVGAVSGVARSAVSATNDEFNQAKTQLSKFGDDFVNGLQMVVGKLETGAQVAGNWVIKHPKFFAHVVVNVAIAVAFPELAPDLALETGGLLLTTILQDTMGQPQPSQEDIDKMIADARAKMLADPTYQASMQELGSFIGYVAQLYMNEGGSIDLSQEGENLYIVGTTPYNVSLDKILIDINPETYVLTLTNTVTNKKFNGSNYTDVITFDGGKDIDYIGKIHYDYLQPKGFGY